MNLGERSVKKTCKMVSNLWTLPLHTTVRFNLYLFIFLSQTCSNVYTGSGRPGRKPTYSIDLDLGDPGQYYKESTYLKNRVFQLCQQCYSLKQYKARFGSDECTNHLAEGDRQSPLSILDLKLFLFKKFEDEEGGRSGYHKNVLLPTKLRLQAAEESRLARNRMIDQLITPNKTAL